MTKETELQDKIEAILKERMFPDFAYGTGDMKYLFDELNDPFMIGDKFTRKVLFIATQNKVIEHIQKNQLHYWFIGKPIIKIPDVCSICHEHIWGKHHGYRCKS